MLKRKLAILIGATLLGTQALSAGAQGDDTSLPLPATERYFAERLAANPNPRGASMAFIPSTDDKDLLPATERYFAGRLAANPNPTGASGTLHTSVDTFGRLLPL